jgi:hypothetical protein
LIYNDLNGRQLFKDLSGQKNRPPHSSESPRDSRFYFYQTVSLVSSAEPPTLLAAQTLSHKGALHEEPTTSTHRSRRLIRAKWLSPKGARMRFWPFLGVNTLSRISRHLLEKLFSLRSQRLQFPSL